MIPGSCLCCRDSGETNAPLPENHSRPRPCGRRSRSGQAAACFSFSCVPVLLRQFDAVIGSISAARTDRSGGRRLRIAIL